MEDQYSGIGGSYVINDNGERVPADSVKAAEPVKLEKFLDDKPKVAEEKK